MSRLQIFRNSTFDFLKGLLLLFRPQKRYLFRQFVEESADLRVVYYVIFMIVDDPEERQKLGLIPRGWNL